MFIILTIIIITIGLIIFILINQKLLNVKFGKILGLIVFILLPVLIIIFSTSIQFENSKTTQFCLSCHIMEPYGKSLRIDDQDYIPANHFQNNLISREEVCFTCHTTYTLFGDIQAKLRGLSHFFNYYFGGKYEKIEMSSPYNNRECLHCHGESRSFLEGEIHEAMMVEIRTNEQSCLDCHSLIHGIEDLDTLKFWNKDKDESK